VPADSLPRAVTTLPPIEVRRERARLDARRRLPTASVTDLRSGEANRALESLSELLAASAGVRVTQYGGLGAFSTLSLRGAPPGQVSVFLDGVPLTSAAHGVVNLADLPVMTSVGLSGAPADAAPEVAARAHWVSAQAGGRGAVREFIELVLRARNQWDDVVARHLE